MIKKIRFSALLLFCAFSAFSQQEWAPIGARWYQNIGSDPDLLPPPYPVLDYYLIECTGDTVVNNLNFRKVGNYLMHQDGGKIYYWWGDSLNLIYDFEAEAGDTVNFNLLHCEGYVVTMPFLVDSTSFVEINGQMLKKVYCSGMMDWLYPETYTYLEKMGRTERVMIEDNAQCAWITNGFIPSWIRCYADSEVEIKSDYFLSLGDYACDYQRPTGTLEAPQRTWSVSPNPTAGLIAIQTEEAVVEARLFSLTGQRLLTARLSGEKRMDVTSVPQGLYWLQLLDGQGTVLGAVKVVVAR